MRRLLLAAILVLLIPLGALAQVEYPRAEVFGGYSYFKANPEGFNLNGWNASVTGNITSYFGIEGDFSGHYGKPKTNGFIIPGVDINAHSFMAGPKLSYRNDYVTPFAHFLIGLNRAGTNDSGIAVSDIALATVIGGGLDINVSEHIAIRPFQADYLMTRFEVYGPDGISDRQNNFRFSAGIVFKFGNH